MLESNSERNSEDLRIIKNHIDGDMNEEQFDKNIVLPIKPEYADKILNGQKKYEYRKNICTDNIEKIYVYATSPVKAIIGELEVVEKMIMNKDNLWKFSEKHSGITKEFYEGYYKIYCNTQNNI